MLSRLVFILSEVVPGSAGERNNALFCCHSPLEDLAGYLIPDVLEHLQHRLFSRLNVSSILMMY